MRRDVLLGVVIWLGASVIAVGIHVGYQWYKVRYHKYNETITLEFRWEDKELQDWWERYRACIS